MDLNLKNKVALVTGAGSPIGFGRRICTMLAEEGCHIIACDISQTEVEESAKLVAELGRESMFSVFDVRDKNAVEEAVKKAVEKFGRIDILINCAGASYSQHCLFIDQSPKEIYFNLEVNLIGQMNVAQAVLPTMIKQKSGRIVNFAGGRGIPGLSTYGAAKAGIIDWTSALAAEIAPHNIYVNVFGPGLSNTGLVKGQSPDFMQKVTMSTKQKRLCNPEDVASFVVFMASERNSYMTGEFVHI